MKNKYYNFEIYTSDPVSGQSGWDIKMVSAKGNSYKEARERLKDFPHFDVVILYNHEHEEEKTSDFLVVENYPKFKILEAITVHKPKRNNS